MPLPEIEFDPDDGPLLILNSPETTEPKIKKEMCLDTGGDLDLAGKRPVAALPKSYISGLKMERQSGNIINVLPGECRDFDHIDDIVLLASVSVNLSLSGIGGLDTGSEAADTWYAIHVIGDSTHANDPDAIASLSATSPTLPAGYDIFRRIGWVRNNASSNTQEFFQSGKGVQRTILYEEPVPNVRALNNGSATTYTNVDLSPWLPPNGRTEVFLQLTFDNNAAGGGNGDDLRVRAGDSTVDNIATRLQPGLRTKAAMQVPVILFTDESQVIQYKVTDTSNIADIIVAGYRDDL
jgi:hypothetical protein